MALAGMLSAVFGVLLEPIEAELGWSRAEISSGPFVVSIMGLFLAAPAGHLIDRWGSRLTGVITITCTFLAILGMAMVGKHLWHWWAAWSVFGIAGAFTSTVWMAPLSTAFSRARGMAIALTIGGASISGAAAPIIAEYFVQNHGWRTAFVALAMIFCGLALPLVMAFVPGRQKPQNTATPTGADSEGEPPAQSELGGFTPREGFRSRNFYLLFFAAFIGGMTGLALTLNLVPVLTFTGISRADAVKIAGLVGLTSLAGRLIGGWLMDNYDVRRLAVIASVCSAIFPTVLIVAPGVVWAALTALIFNGVTGGLKMSAIVYLTSTHLDARSFGLFYGAISTATTVAMGAGPLIANHVFDLTQSYWPTIWLAVPGFLVSAGLYAALGPAPDFSHPVRSGRQAGPEQQVAD